MKLSEGLYEQLIDTLVNESINEGARDNLRADIRALDPGDSHTYLAQYLGIKIRNAFALVLGTNRLESNAVVLSLYEARMSALAILNQPRKRSVVQISESRPGHFASIRRLPN